jgi:glycosyltransferase involved in cell wall biosynthesis
MPNRRSFDVSVVIPFSDHEDVIGTAVSRLANHLREYGVSFEVLAVDDDSGDNSHAILALLRTSGPELRVIGAGARGRGIEVGARRAQGHVLWLVEPIEAMHPLAPFGRAYRRVSRGEHDGIVVRNRFVVCHRTRCLGAIEGIKGHGHAFERKFTKRAAQRDLDIDTQVLGGDRRVGSRFGQRPLARLFDAIAPSRAW